MAMAPGLQKRGVLMSAPLPSTGVGLVLAFVASVGGWFAVAYHRWDSHQGRLLDVSAERPGYVHLVFPKV